MRADQLLVAHLSAALLGVALVGLAARGRWRFSLALTLYMSFVLAGNRLTVHWPEIFWTYSFWRAKSTVYTLLLALVPLEVAALTFQRFPRARWKAQMILAAILVIMMAAAVTARESDASTPFLASIGLTTSAGEASALWLIVGVLALAAWHRIPVHPFHRATLVAFGAYLVVYSCLLGHVQLNSASGLRADYLAAQAYLGALDPLAFAATLGVVALAAWRRPRPVEERPVLAALQPWARSW